MLTQEAILNALEEVKDPEIPMVSIVELGLVRKLVVEGNRVIVSMTPTFAGCPALPVMQVEVKNRLQRLGAAEVDVRWVLSPPWTTDWISEAGRFKLKDFGLAPPPHHGGLIQIILSEDAACPHCGSSNTALKNNFGASLCRALYYCNECQEPFEQFKAL